jgi:hypothetical protein
MSDDGVGPVEPTAGGSADTVLAGLEFAAPNHHAPDHHAPDHRAPNHAPRPRRTR